MIKTYGSPATSGFIITPSAAVLAPRPQFVYLDSDASVTVKWSLDGNSHVISLKAGWHPISPAIVTAVSAGTLHGFTS